MSVSKSPALLERLRKCLRAGDTLAVAAERCGVGKKIAEGLIRRHGRGPTPVPAPVPGAPRPGGCQWPTSEGRPWKFCDNPAEPGRSYCATHMARAFIKAYRHVDRPFTLARLGS